MKTFNYIEKEERPGNLYVIHNQEKYKIKRLEIKPGKD